MTFLTENGLDFTAFPSLLRLEVEVVSMVLAHLRAPAGAVGSFTTGGTESIFLACKSARECGRAVKVRPSRPLRCFLSLFLSFLFFLFLWCQASRVRSLNSCS